MNTPIKITKPRKIKPIIAEVEKDEDGYWAYYKPGYKSATDPIGAQHWDHEDTRREIMSLVKSAIKCDCDECKKELKT